MAPFIDLLGSDMNRRIDSKGYCWPELPSERGYIEDFNCLSLRGCPINAINWWAGARAGANNFWDHCGSPSGHFDRLVGLSVSRDAIGDVGAGGMRGGCDSFIREAAVASFPSAFLPARITGLRLSVKSMHAGAPSDGNDWQAL